MKQSDFNKSSGGSYEDLASNSTFNSFEEFVESDSKKLLAQYRENTNHFNQERILSRTGKTISRKTQLDYCRRGRSLFKRFIRKTGSTEPFGSNELAIQFYQFVRSLKSSYPKKIWNFYALCALEINSMLSNLRYEDAKSILYGKNVTVTNLPNRQVATKTDQVKEFGSAKTPYAKSVTNKQFKMNIKYIQGRTDSKSATLLINWLIAGMNTGLRQKEWLHTELRKIKDKNAPNKIRILLSIVNLKTPNGEKHRKTRCMDLSELSKSVLEAIEFMVDQGKIWRETGTYAVDRNSAGQLMKEANTVFKMPNGCILVHPTMRFQFLNKILKCLPKEDAVELMGHHDLETIKVFYLQPKTGWRGVDIGATPRPVSSPSQ